MLRIFSSTLTNSSGVSDKAHYEHKSNQEASFPF